MFSSLRLGVQQRTDCCVRTLLVPRHSLLSHLQVEKVKKECLPGASGLDCPLLEEYDFAHDTVRGAATQQEQPLRLAAPCGAQLGSGVRSADRPGGQGAQRLHGNSFQISHLHPDWFCCQLPAHFPCLTRPTRGWTST